MVTTTNVVEGCRQRNNLGGAGEEGFWEVLGGAWWQWEWLWEWLGGCVEAIGEVLGINNKLKAA